MFNVPYYPERAVQELTTHSEQVRQQLGAAATGGTGARQLASLVQELAEYEGATHVMRTFDSYVQQLRPDSAESCARLMRAIAPISAEEKEGGAETNCARARGRALAVASVHRFIAERLDNLPTQPAAASPAP
jgi:hypothetical protein